MSLPNSTSLLPGVSNPFYTGCLHQKLEGWTNLRVCNRDDPPNAAALGACRDPPFDYLEIRVGTGNWDSATALGWLTQIVLSEILGVPSSIESGQYGTSRDFYDASGRIDYDSSVGWQPLAQATELPGGDCRSLIKTNLNDESYKPCSHFQPEMWGTVNEPVLEGKLEPPQGTGFLGEEYWYVTKFTADEFPELVSYHGLKPENREKLAATFKRPTTWWDYCHQVSPNNCTTADAVAQRAPADETENQRMFVQDVYTGYFRYTDKNNCTMFPDNCTGHIANYPCGWSSNMESYIYHEKIPLDPNNGPNGEPNGYTASQLIEMWTAANVTKSHLMMMWWNPEPLYQRFIGSDAEFQHVMLKPYTLKCDAARSVYKDECSSNQTIRVGTPEMACDNPPEPLRKLISGGLYDVLNDPEISAASRSPAYDMLRMFQITQVQLGELFDLWESEESPRDAICTWAANNFDFLNSTVPYSYPRVTQEEGHSKLSSFALSAGCLATFLVLVTFALVHHKHQTPSIQFAQYDFLSILLTGSLMVSMGAILTSLPASSATCIAAVWFVHVGYTLELVPLIIKVAAINRMMEAARELRRITIQKDRLYKAVGVVCIPLIACLIAWTVVDPPEKVAEFSLTEDYTDTVYKERIVDTNYYCNGGDSDAWQYVALGWNTVLLLCASVLAFQTRNVVQNFNESRTLAFMIYSHFVFVVLRIGTFMLSDQLDGSTATQLRSLLYAADQMTTCVIYFLPKLFFKIEIGRNESMVYSGGSTSNLAGGMNIHSNRNSERNGWLRRLSKSASPPLSRVDVGGPSHHSFHKSSSQQTSSIDLGPTPAEMPRDEDGINGLPVTPEEVVDQAQDVATPKV